MSVLIGADYTTYCPTDGVNIDPAALSSISATFAVTLGSAVVPVSADLRGTLYPGALITFSSQAVQYSVYKVTASTVTLSVPYTGTTAGAATATTAAGTDLTVVFKAEPFARRLTAGTAGRIVVNMIGSQGTANAVTLYLAAGGHQDGIFTGVVSMTASVVAALR